MSSETWLWIIATAALILHFLGGHDHGLIYRALRIIVAMLIKLTKGEVLSGRDRNTLQELEKALKPEEE